MQKVKCVKEFFIDKYDDDGRSIANEYIDIEEGSIFEIENDFRFIGGEIRLLALDTDTPFRWLEITKQTFEEHFEIIV